MDKVGGSNELNSLLNVLENVPANQFVLSVDPGIVSLLSALTPYSTLTQRGVTALLPLSEKNCTIKHDTEAVVYITKPVPQLVSLMAQGAIANPGVKQIAVIVPEESPSVNQILSEYGVFGDFELVNWPVLFVKDTVHPSILSLFDEDSVTDPLLSVWPLVFALDSLQMTVTGSFGKVTAIGPKSTTISRLLKDKRKEHIVKLQASELSANHKGPEFYDYHFGYSSQTFSGETVEQLVIMDRDLDLVTPMLVQATYEGVLDETFGISAGGTVVIKQEAGTINAVTKVGLKNDIMMDSLGDMGFSEACKNINESAKKLQQDYQSDDIAKESSTLSEIKATVVKLGSLQSNQRLVDTHTEIASAAMAQLTSPVVQDAFNLQTSILMNQIANSDAVGRIQDLIFRGCALPSVLRLICLLCLVRGGIKENILHSVLYGDILRTYGFEHIATLHYLEKRGLLFYPRASSILSSLGITSFGSTPEDAAKKSRNTPEEIASSSASISTSTTPSTNPADRFDQLEEPLAQAYSWNALNKAFNLYPHDADNIPEAVPYAGYIPLAARLVQNVLGQTPVARNPLDQITTEEVPSSKTDEAYRESKLRRTLQKNSLNSKPPVILVVVVGGVTYAEAAAIEIAVKKELKRDVNVVIATNSLITGDSIILGNMLPN